MKVTTLDEKAIRDIGHAFGYYDYGEETGMSAAFSGKEATANYICAYVRGVLRGGFLHTTSERGEGYIAYKLPKEKMGLKTMWPIACGMLHNSTLKRLLQFGIAIKRGGAPLGKKLCVSQLYLLPDHLALHLRIVQSDFRQNFLFAGFGIQHMAFAVE